MLSSLLLHRRLGSMARNVASIDNWHGAIEVVIAAPVGKVWAIASNWLNFPRSASVECTGGKSGEPGCVRRVQAKNSNFWVEEILTGIDHDNRILCYDIIGGNSGIASGYKAAIQATAERDSSTRVVWPFKFSSDQLRAESMTPIIKTKVTAHIKELEELAQNL